LPTFSVVHVISVASDVTLAVGGQPEFLH